MEPIFQNRYVRDKDTVKALYRFILFKSPSAIAIQILLALDFLLILSEWTFRNDTTLILFLLLIPFYYLMRILAYFNMTNNLIRRDKEVNKGMPVEVQIDVTEDSLIGTTSAGVNEIPFTSVKKVYRTKKMILLKTKAKQVFLLRADSFTKGTAEDFAAFLRSKGYKVK